MAYLTLRGINMIYPNGFHAVHDFNLEIGKGEFIVFVGSFGCGKSTTLRMIAWLENISKGDFLIDGVRANEKGPRERGVAMVFQSYALYPHITNNPIDLSRSAEKEILESIEGREVVFGFRPEAVKTAEDSVPENCFRMISEVELVELLGDNTNVYVDVYDAHIILKVDPHVSAGIGTGFEFYVPYESVYLFDKETEKRIKLRK